MSNLGFGVMIHQLFGDNRRSAEVLLRAIGKTITALHLGNDNALHFEFEDCYKMKLFDDGQSCCESRYMTTDDNLAYFVGAELMDVEVREAPTVVGEYGEEHEVQFLVITTSKGCFTMESHNEHNGYYGGFAIEVAEEEA